MSAVSALTVRKYAKIARKYGMNYAWTAVKEATDAGLPASLGLALATQETTTARNIYGHDPVPNPAPKGGHVTKANYLGIYLPARKRGLGMQGVGPLQLTWYATQDTADKLGGCWNPKYSFRVGYHTLAALIRVYGYVDGIRRYNGSGSRAVAYSASVRRLAALWQGRLQHG